jgi:hypothetical protein
VREEYLLPAAREAFDSLVSRDQERIEEIIQDLCHDPSLDPPLKEKFDVPPVVLSRYNDTFFWIVYDLPDEATLRVWMIGKGSDEPRPY